MKTASRSREGFTLVELLVAMSVMIILASIVLLVVPGVLDQDRTTDGAARLQQYLMIAKSRASRDGLPRGLRLLGSGNATEVQYIESPPLFVPDNSLYPKYTAPSGAGGSPRVEFEAVINSAGNITGHNVYLKDLPGTVPAEIAGGGSVIIAEPRVYFAFSSYTGPTTPVATVPNTGIQPYPDMGAGTKLVCYLFGIYGPPQPLLGEPVQQMPSNIGIDLTSSSGLSSQDLLFTPAGDLMSATGGQVFLWIRDITKNGGSSGSYNTGGEQQVVAIKTRSGSLGVFPVAWVPPNTDPFMFAKQGATGP